MLCMQPPDLHLKVELMPFYSALCERPVGGFFYFYFSFAIRFLFEEADICLGPTVLWEYAAVEGLVR